MRQTKHALIHENNKLRRENLELAQRLNEERSTKELFKYYDSQATEPTKHEILLDDLLELEPKLSRFQSSKYNEQTNEYYGEWRFEDVHTAAEQQRALLLLAEFNKTIQ